MQVLTKDIFESIKYAQQNPSELKTNIGKLFSIDKKTVGKYRNINLDEYTFNESLNIFYKLEELEKNIIDDFLINNLSFAEICRKYKISNNKLKNILITTGNRTTRNFKYHYNRNAFEKIETEEDAYILGFILADGYICESRTCLRIKLHNRDEDILEKINKYLESDNPIKHQIHSKTKNIISLIEFNSSQIIKNLKDKGLCQAKSTKEVPYYDISKNLMKHYIRGIFDGDGFIKKNAKQIGVCGSKEVLDFIMNYFKEIDLVDTSKMTNNPRFDKTSNIYRLSFCGQNAINVINYLYKDSKIYLNRKYKLAEKYF